MMVQKASFSVAIRALNSQEMKENFKLLPTDLLSREEYDKYDKEVDKKLIALTLEMAKKQPDCKTDKALLRAEVIKEEMITAKEGIIAGDLAINEAIHNLISYVNAGQQKFERHPDPFINCLSAFLHNLEYYQEIAKRQLKVDEANLKKLKALVDEQMSCLMVPKCGSSSDITKMMPTLSKIASKYEESAFKCTM